MEWMAALKVGLASAATEVRGYKKLCRTCMADYGEEKFWREFWWSKINLN